MRIFCEIIESSKFNHALGALGPIAAAFLVSAAEPGLAGPGDLLRRMGLWRGRLVWVAVALLAPFALHTPLFFYRPGYTSMDAAGAAGWLFSLLTGAVLLTWLYNESRGSILVVALFHAAVDVAFTSEISSPFVVNTAGAIITVWGLIVLAAAGPGYLSRRGKMVRLYDGGAVTGFDHRDG